MMFLHYVGRMHGLICELEAVEGLRSGNAKKHRPGDILFIAIAAGVADADTWNQIEDYAAGCEEFFLAISKTVRRRPVS